MMNNNLFLMSFGIGAMMLAANHVNAQTCADHATVVERLATQFGERRHSIALAHDNTVVEIFVAMDSGSWTITATAPGAPTCLVAAGQAFEYISQNITASGQPV